MRKETADILSLINSYALPNHDDTALKIATDFRQRRIEKGITRAEIAQKADVAMANVARFEQTGQISLKNLIELAWALGYLPEVSNLFAEAKFSTMAELDQIRKNKGKKKAYRKSNTPDK